jgi:hypothetical protein
MGHLWAIQPAAQPSFYAQFDRSSKTVVARQSNDVARLRV